MKMGKALADMLSGMCVSMVLLVMSAPAMAAWNEGQIKWTQGTLRENGFYRGAKDGRWSQELEQALQTATRDFVIPTDDSQDKRDMWRQMVVELYNNRYEHDLATRKASKHLSILPTLPPPGSYSYVRRETGEYTHIVHKTTWSFFPDGKCQWREHFINETNAAVNSDASLLGRCQLVKWESGSTPKLFFWVAHQSGENWTIKDWWTILRTGGAKNMPQSFSFDQYGNNLLIGGRLHEKAE